MSERFVVVPVEGKGAAGGSGGSVTDAASDTGDGGDAAIEQVETGDDSVFEPPEPDALVPILEYNREPNKYGKMTDKETTTHVFLHVCS